jgi:Domain of unknown function (DUF4431)
MARLLSLFVFATVSIASSAAAQCMKADAPGQIAEGRLSIGRATDAAGRPERPYILTLPVPVCLDGPDPDDRVKSTRAIHVYPANDKLARDFRRFVGKTVLVRGRPFAAHTAHHHAPIVMEVSEIDTQ